MKIVLTVLTLVFASCANFDHVRPGADGVHRVVIRGKDKTLVEKRAIDEANDFCDQKKQFPAFVSEETKYTGSIDEDTHKTIQKVSEAAMVGGVMMGNTRHGENSTGHGVYTAGAVGSMFEDKEAYTADMKFKCQ